MVIIYESIYVDFDSTKAGHTRCNDDEAIWFSPWSKTIIIPYLTIVIIK